LIDYDNSKSNVTSENQRLKESVAETIAIVLQSLLVNSENKNFSVKNVVARRVLPSLIEACKHFKCAYLTKNILELTTIASFIEWEKKSELEAFLSHIADCIK